MPERLPVDWGAADELVDRLRHRGDGPADAVIAAFDEALTARPHHLWPAAADQVRGDPVAEDPAIDAYLRTPAWPDWADPARIEVAQAFFAANTWAVSVAFLLGSLPMSYTSRIGALVLARTGRLHDDAQRRIFETALLVMEIAGPGGMSDGGDGYLTLRRLRLLHAAARRALLVHGFDARRSDGGPVSWDVPTQGCPLSQLDLLGTTWAFALASVDALRGAGHEVTDADEEAWVHLWSVAGHLLGIGTDPIAGPLLPMGPSEARACFDRIRHDEFGPGAEGRGLAADLLAVGHARVPWKRYDGLVEALVRDHLGDQRADWLGIPPTVDVALLSRARRLWGLEADRAVRQSRLDRLGHWRVHHWLLRRLARRLTRPEEVDRSLRTPAARDRLLEAHLEGVGRWAARRRRARGWFGRRSA